MVRGRLGGGGAPREPLDGRLTEGRRRSQRGPPCWPGDAPGSCPLRPCSVLVLGSGACILHSALAASIPQCVGERITIS
jgi:hypothetical protein